MVQLTKKELIEGGWIDQYVLGLTSEEESAEVERLAALYPDVQEQINQARHKVCGTFNRNLTRTAMRHSFLTKRKVITGSAVVVLLVLGGFAFLCKEHFTLRKDYHSQCEKLAQEQARAAELSSVSKKLTERAKFVNSNTTKRIKLKGCDAAPEAEVLVFHCKLTGKMMMQVIDLPVLPEGQHYEVWAHHPKHLDRKVGMIESPVRYDSLYVLDTVSQYTALQISSFDPVQLTSEPVCLATVK